MTRPLIVVPSILQVAPRGASSWELRLIDVESRPPSPFERDLRLNVRTTKTGQTNFRHHRVGISTYIDPLRCDVHHTSSDCPQTLHLPLARRKRGASPSATRSTGRRAPPCEGSETRRRPRPHESRSLCALEWS